MKKFTLTETEDIAPDYEYKEEFDTLEEAQARMKDMYHQTIIEGNQDAVDKTEINDRSIYVYLNDGNKISWEIWEN